MGGTSHEIIDTTAVTVRDGADTVRAEDFMPLMSVDQAVERKRMMNQFIGKVLKDGDDYGTMPGGQTKKVLMKPGAEKLCSIFGLAPKYLKEVIVEDWTGAQHGGEPLFSYEYRCQLWRGHRFMGEAIGSCNSWESKYRYRWVAEDVARKRNDFDSLPMRESTVTEFAFAIDKGETTGQYGKPKEYWDRWREAIQKGEARSVERTTKAGRKMPAWEMGGTSYRIPNPDVADVINTCQKMAQKRALVAAVLVVTNCSDAFAQDLEEGLEHEINGGQEESRAPTVKQKPPKELEIVFRDIDQGSLSAAAAAYSKIEGMMIKKAGDVGYEEYGKLSAEFSDAYPQGTTDKEAHKTFLLRLWAAYEALKAPEATAK